MVQRNGSRLRGNQKFTEHPPVSETVSGWHSVTWEDSADVVSKDTRHNFSNVKSSFEKVQGFPGGAVVESPPAGAGDTGSSPDPGGSHMPRSNWARVPQLLSLRSRAFEPQLLSPSAATTEARALQQEKLPQWEAPARSNEDPTQPKLKKFKKKKKKYK